MLRLPFPAFAIAFTDRYALGLLERLISRSAERPERRGFFQRELWIEPDASLEAIIDDPGPVAAGSACPARPRCSGCSGWS